MSRPPHTTIHFRSVALAALCATALFINHPAPAQTINIDFGTGGAAHQPASTYAAAGLPGYWNSIPALNGTSTFNLIDIHGNVTPVKLTQVGGTQTLLANDPATTGDDEKLMDDYLVTFSATLESCLFIDFLQPGTYTFLIYARMPNQPAVMGYTNCDEEPGNPHYEVGGAWLGEHEEFITYSRHVAVVSDNGKLRGHSGIAPGDNPALGAALNGVQFRRVPDCPADIMPAGPQGGDNHISIADVVAIITNYNTSCGICPEDIAPEGGDGSVSIADITAIVAAFGSSNPEADIAPPNGDGTLGDGSVTIADVIAAITAFGPC
jgi:hypothetical protein